MWHNDRGSARQFSIIDRSTSLALMDRLIRRALALGIALTCATGIAMAATSAEFYLNLLRRGIGDFNAGRLESAATELEIAAFGLLDSVDHFQTAQVYLAITNDRLGREAAARRAAQRVLAAERVQQRFAALSLPADVRGGFSAVTRKLLTTEELAALGLASAVQSVPPPQVAATSTPASAQPATNTQIAVPASQTATPPQNPAPARTEITTPAPQVTPRRTPVRPPVDVAARLRDAERAISASDLPTARGAYADILTVTSLDHATLLRVAEGTYRSRDFRNTVAAFARLGALAPNEEPYRYYLAVALYETGEYARAKRELAAVLPAIEITPDVAAYRAKIEAAID
jgi:tetratricopeptide (TPR) repeat protein